MIRIRMGKAYTYKKLEYLEVNIMESQKKILNVHNIKNC